MSEQPDQNNLSNIRPENPLPPDTTEENSARMFAFFGILVAVALIVLVAAEAADHKNGMAAQNVGTDGTAAAATIPPAQTGISGTPVLPASPVPAPAETAPAAGAPPAAAIPERTASPLSPAGASSSGGSL